MIRLIRTRTLRTLRAEITEADEAAAVYSAEADKWNEKYVAEVQRADDAEQAIGQTAELRVEDCEHYEEQLAELREQLADAIHERDAARAEREQQFTGLHAVIKQVTGERDAARAEADQWNRAYCTEVKVANDAEAAAAALREQLAAGRPALGAGAAWGRIDQDVTTAAAESAGHVAARATEHKEVGQ